MLISERIIIDLPIPIEILWLIIGIILVLFFSIALILNHHWKYYGIKNNSKVFAKGLFWVGSFILIMIMVLSVLLIESL